MAPSAAGTEANRSTVSENDADLVTLARSDPRVFGDLFDRYWNDVFKFCYYRLGDWHWAEDIASQVFLEAMSSLHAFDPRGRDDSFRGWLFGIARNLTASAVRSHQRQPLTGIDQDAPLVDRAESPEDQAIASDEFARLRALIVKLPPEQQELIELRLAGLTSAEIASILDKSHDAVRKAQSRTLAALRQAAAETPSFSPEAHHG